LGEFVPLYGDKVAVVSQQVPVQVAGNDTLNHHDVAGRQIQLTIELLSLPRDRSETQVVPWHASACPTSYSIKPTVSRSRSSRREQQTTFAPCLANSIVIARPPPQLDSVMTAVFPCNSMPTSQPG
jgi:hypothetical protein